MKMLLQPTKNKFILNSYELACNIFVGFGSFIIVFGIFSSVFFEQWVSFIFKKFIYDAVSHYTEFLKTFDSKIKLGTLINYLNNTNDIVKDSDKKDIEIHKHNSYYDNLLLYIVGRIIGFFVLILVVPVVLGFIPYSILDWKQILTNFIVHLILIVSFEAVLLLVILPMNNPIRLGDFFDGAGY